MITFDNVTKVYPPDRLILDRVRLEIGEGEFVSIVGQSGVGKTTLLKLLLADEPVTEGRITLDDWDITNIRSRELPFLRRQIGTIIQDFKLLPRRTVHENIAFALEVVGAPYKRIADIVPEVINLVGLDGCEGHYPPMLSGGEAQRVAIARALVHRPKILVADEPTGNLDAIHAREIIDLLSRINSFGTTVILVTHNREVVNRLRRRVVVIDKGRIASDRATGKYTLT